MQRWGAEEEKRKRGRIGGIGRGLEFEEQGGGMREGYIYI
jgi:hypothetical protein